MRPPVPDVPLPRARKASFEQPGSDPRITSPATFFLSRRPNHDSYSDSDSDNAEASRDSMYGVQSLDDAVHQATLAASECDDIPAADSGKLSPNPASHNNNEHDATEASLGHARRHHVAQPEVAAHVAGHHAVERLVGHVDRRAVVRVDRRAAHQRVDAAPLGAGVVDQRLDQRLLHGVTR